MFSLLTVEGEDTQYAYAFSCDGSTTYKLFVSAERYPALLSVNVFHVVSPFKKRIKIFTIHIFQAISISLVR